jgi:hypothetical protein
LIDLPGDDGHFAHDDVGIVGVRFASDQQDGTKCGDVAGCWSAIGGGSISAGG